jgi:hypothetical protein
MAKSLQIDLFCEDRGHERFVYPLLQRIVAECGVQVEIDTQTARGGAAKAKSELRAYQRALLRQLREPVPDLLVVVIDGNCTTWSTMRSEVRSTVDDELFPHCVVGCPDPHVERWCFADPRGFASAVGVQAPRDPDKCDRAAYKYLLGQAIADAGQLVLADSMDIAPDIVKKMDLHRAGRNQASLGAFLSDLRSAVTQLSAE